MTESSWKTEVRDTRKKRLKCKEIEMQPYGGHMTEESLCGETVDREGGAWMRSASKP